MKHTVTLTVALVLVAGGLTIAQRTSVARDFPIYNNAGRPDLTIDPDRLVSQMGIVDRYFDSSGCEVHEGLVGGTGYRRILRFDTVVMNAADGDLVVGDISDPSNPYAHLFIFSSCHGHYHIAGFSSYQLLNLDRTVAAEGHKQAFCLEDSLKYDGDKSHGYDCDSQGITSGWGSWYVETTTG